MTCVKALGELCVTEQKSTELTKVSKFCLVTKSNNAAETPKRQVRGSLAFLMSFDPPFELEAYLLRMFLVGK